MTKKWYEISGISVLMLILALVSTYPLLQYFDTAIPYSPFGGAKVWNRSGDQMQLMYWFWLVKENILGNVPFDSNPFEFNPFETSGLNTIPLAFLFMLFSPLGDVAAYNSTIILSYVLTGLFTYLLVRLYSGSRAGALLAAIVFTFAPYRIRGLAAGHGYGLLFFCYPFILYYLEKGIRLTKIRYGVISSLGLIGLAMVEPHLIYYICVFLGIFIPIRILALLPVDTTAKYPFDLKSLALPVFCSFFLIWGAGVSATLYAQAIFYYRGKVALVNEMFWWAIVLYPLVLVLFSLCFTAIYQRLSTLDFRESIAVEAKSLLPLFLLLPLALVARYFQPISTDLLVLVSLLAIFLGKLWLLRVHLFQILKKLVIGSWERKSSILPIIPIIVSMGAIVYWISSSKVKQVASTIAGGGRSLDDVGLFSARLADLFDSIGNVYIGVIPALIGGAFLCFLLTTCFSGQKRVIFADEISFLRLFYFLIAFSCLILSLGLAFGEISLYALFFHYFPFFNYPRVSDRIITLSLFALVIVIGFSIKGIQSHIRSRTGKIAVIVVVIAASAFQLKDYNVFKPMGINVLDRGQDIYTYVKNNIGEGLLLEIPLWPGDSHQSALYQHYIMMDRVPRVNGSSPLVLKEYVETIFEPLNGINQGKLGREQFELLHELGVRFITVHDNRDVFVAKVSPFTPLATVRRLQNSPYLEEVYVDNYMHFKTWKGKNNRLYLFELKSMNDVSQMPDQAWYEMPYFYDVNWRLHKQIGRIVEEPILNRNVFEAVEGQDRPGFLVYGPYDVYSPGEYRCYFSINLDGRQFSAGKARIEVSAVDESGDVSVLALKELQGGEKNQGYRKEYIDFTIDTNTKLEFRVFYYGIGEVRVEKISVNKTGSDEPLYFLKAEKMVGDTGQVRVENDAVTGKVIEAVVGRSAEGEMVYGPNKIYEKGLYTARFFLRARHYNKQENNPVVAVVSVTEGQDLKVFAKREVRLNDVKGGKFTGVEVSFDLQRDENLSFHVFFTQKTTLQLDGIEIIRE
jgi:hypothetical protein